MQFLYDHLVTFALALFAALALCLFARLLKKRIARLATELQHRLRPASLAVFLSFAALATIFAQKPATNETASANIPLKSLRSDVRFSNPGGLDDDFEDTFAISNLCITGIAPLSNSVWLSVAWPTNMFVEGTTLDFFAKISALTNEWTWLDAYGIMPYMTNMEVEIAYPALALGPIVPSVMFFRVQDRNTCAVTMRDADLDGVPDVYELNNGTNPYVPDAALVHRLTVGRNSTYTSLEAALANSMAYSVVSLGEETFVQHKSLVLPSHPVLIEGPGTGYAVIQSDAEIGAIMLSDGQDAQTVFRNLIVDLRAQRNFQAGFWIGGNTPWAGRGAAATFENVRIRANYPGVEHFGWLFYGNGGGSSILKRCVMNAAGSTWAYGVSAYNAASNVMENCAFLNMPTNAGEVSALSILMRESTNGVVDVRSPEGRPDLSWAGCPYDGAYSRTADADGDGIPDYDEVFLADTDPWLADSDGDGIPDGEELDEETDPCDLNSHGYRLDLSVRNADCIANVTNYVFIGTDGGQWSGMVYSCRERGGATNLTLTINGGMLVVSSYRDLNRNGAFDPDYDIALSNNVSGLQAVSRIAFSFGDIDGDGVCDLQERQDETDPYSRSSLKIFRTVRISNADSNAQITNYYAITQSPAVADAQWTRMTSDQLTIPVSQRTTSGCLYALVFRDLNGDGVYEEGIDALYDKNRFDSNPTEFTVSLGDVDGDKIDDSRELQEGTDPLDPKSYCYQVEARINGVFSTTNLLTCSASFGTNELLTATIVTNDEFVAAIGHCSTTNGELVTLWFWDDANSNSVRDVDETCTSISIKPNGHEVSYEGTLPTSAFDKDCNGLMDWWECQSGLSALEESHGKTDDNDHDGLINLHEYWAGTDPLTPDGSNTLLSVCARSIDNRIAGKDPGSSLELLTHYLENATELRFERNENNWLADVDLTGMGLWTEQGPSNQRAPVAISSIHVMLATHWPVDVGKKVWFVDQNGSVVSNEIKMIQRVTLPGLSVWDVDVAVALLKEPLPASISVVKLFPESVCDKLGNGERIPVVQINQEKEARVAELLSLELGRTKHNSYTSFTQPWRRDFSKNLRSGDSGSPTFAIVDNHPVLLGLHHTADSDPAYWALSKEIQAAMDSLSPTNRILLQTLDISRYPDIRRFP